ncbi:MAG: hypothetical protein ACOX08_01425 [Methanobacterium sp.]|nr:hypothetical protein [Methanobacterium sp.]
MTDDEVPKGWWAQQSSGAKIAIGIVCICCVGLIVIVGLTGMMAPDATTSSSDTSPSTSSSQKPDNTRNSDVKTIEAKKSYIEVSYDEGYWDGSITIKSGNNEEELDFDGSGTKKFDLSNYKKSDVYVMAQKQDGGNGKLTAVIVKNGETKLTQSTNKGYGIVSGWVFSWE